jgi:glyoxylase-like metal-dependent hydrolase (beta-lactamase superfamily II)
MDAPYQGSSDVLVLPTSITIPGVGVLPINAFLLMAEEPVLVDTGLGMDSPEFIDAVSSIVPFDQIKWVWLTHDDADHTGSIQKVMELAPNAKLVTQGLCAMRMSSWWQVPLHRVHAIRAGDELHVGDRTLTAVAPPLFDNPMSTGFIDRSTGALFTVDAFGALLPEATQSANDVPPEALAGGMAGWATSDSPWVHITDKAKFGEVLERVRQLAPSRIFSSHLPAADGTSMDEFIRILAMVPDAEEHQPPNAEQFGMMIEAMTAAQQAGGLPEQRTDEPAQSPVAPA